MAEDFVTNYYNIIGVKRDCSFQELKRAYYRQVKLCHPDLFNNSPGKTEEFKRLAIAFDTLSDPEKRAIYDAKIYRSDSQVSTSTVSASTVSVMDSPADDILEELISGNTIPTDTSLATLLLDITKTEIFITFREGKNYFFQKRYRAALFYMEQAVKLSPWNILYRVYLGRTLAVLRQYRRAKKHYCMAIKLGDRRIPPQRLTTVRSELTFIRQRHHPLAYHLGALFRGKDKTEPVSDEQKLIDATNNSIANIMHRTAKEESAARRLLR